MRVLLLPFGTTGDVHPYVGLGLALSKRGHSVLAATNGAFRGVFERHGIEFIEQGTRDEYISVLSHPDLWNPLRWFAHIYRNGVGPAARAQLALVESLRPFDDLVVISCCVGSGARLAQEKFGVHFVSLHLQPACLWSDIESPMMAGLPRLPSWLNRHCFALCERIAIDRPALLDLNALRREIGLPPARRLARWWHSRWLVLGLFPEWFAPRQPDWPVHFEHAGFPLWDEGADSPLDPHLEAFLASGAPHVVLTPGTGNLHARRFFEEGVAACETLGRRALLVTRFPEQVPSNLPRDMRHVGYAPFARLLPRVAAIVHHGGIGTMAQAMRAGTPQLVVPTSHDQPDNAARAVRLGIGLELSSSRFNRQRAEKPLRAIIEGRNIAVAARRVASRMSDANGIERAVDLIEARVDSERAFSGRSRSTFA